MINGYDKNQLDEWRSSLNVYQKQKRTKKPFGKSPQIYDKHIVDSSQIQQKQRQFDPVLQKYNNYRLQKLQEQRSQQRKNNSLTKYMKNQVKNQKTYDIVNLSSFNNMDREQNPQKGYNQWSRQKNKNNPIRNLYNIINNQHIPNEYMMNRNIRVNDKPNSKRVYEDKYKQPEFDIVRSQFIENNQVKQQQEIEKQHSKIKQKANKKLYFDNVTQRFYNPELENQYQQQLHKSMLTHGKDFNDKLPPAYRNRQPCMFSYDQNNIPQALKRIQQKQQNTRKMHQLRYAVQEQYKKRNDEDFQKHQQLIRNKVHQGKILQNMIKQHDIINNKLFQMNRSQFFDKKINEHPYSYNFLNKSNNASRQNSVQRNQYKLQDNWQTQSHAYSERSRSSAGNSQNRRYSIKSGGFN